VIAQTDKLVQMLRENPRTLKELAESLGTTKQEALDALVRIGAEAVQTTSRNGTGRPFVVVHYKIA